MCKSVLNTILVFLTATLMFGQQSGATPDAGTTAEQRATNSQATTATGEPPLVQQKPQSFWDGDQPGLGSLLFHPFASKAYVRRQLGPIDDRVKELDALTDSNRKKIGHTDESASRGIQLVSAKTNEADQHASDAATKAQSAQQSASQVQERVGVVEGAVAGIDSYKSTNQVEIRFRSRQSPLSADSKHTLDQLASSLKGQRGYVIETYGYAAGRGQSSIAASRRMADAVVRYLTQTNGIPAYRIYPAAMGDAYPTDSQRRHVKTGGWVQLKVLKNDLDQLAASGANTSK